MTLYLKYRPQRIEELDLTNVRETLGKIVKSGKIPHAFLFAGPKGTGKTSAARILAKVINCLKLKDGEPCNACDQCISITNGSNMDVVEIDAASNRGIDDVRVIRENVILAPASGKRKIYIIDEAHMLTTEASNAFLKTLEEPPDHVVFILATTNPEKLPETVRSRLTTVPFRRGTDEEISGKLKRVIEKEKFKLTGNPTALIAKAADGSFRDAIKILEQISTTTDEISEKAVLEFLAQGKLGKVEEFLELLKTKNTPKLISEIEKMCEAGLSMRNFTDSILTQLHREVLVNASTDVLSLIKLLYDAKRDMAVSPIEQMPLEMAIVKWCNSMANDQGLMVNEAKKKEIRQVEPKESKLSAIGHQSLTIDSDVWRKLLENLKNKNTTVEALLRAAKPMAFDGNTFTVGVYYQFHKERLEVMQNRRVMEDVLCGIMGVQALKVLYVLTEKPHNALASRGEDTLTATKDKDIIEAAKEIFG